MDNRSQDGKKPANKTVANFEKMLQEKGFNKIGLALVTEGEVHLLEYRKMRFAGYKAARTKGPNVRKEAAKKAWETRKHTE